MLSWIQPTPIVTRHSMTSSFSFIINCNKVADKAAKYESSKDTQKKCCCSDDVEAKLGSGFLFPSVAVFLRSPVFCQIDSLNSSVRMASCSGLGLDAHWSTRGLGLVTTILTLVSPAPSSGRGPQTSLASPSFNMKGNGGGVVRQGPVPARPIPQPHPSDQEDSLVQMAEHIPAGTRTPMCAHCDMVIR